MLKLWAAVAAAGIAAVPASPVTALAGRYSKHFQNGLVDGSKYESDDVIEIVPVDATHAYFRASLQFFNGHSCDVSGVARDVGNKLVYTETETNGAGRVCKLSISASGKFLMLDDGDGGCQRYCGARGTLTKFRFVPLSSRRAITYLPRLKGSREYQRALAKWKAGETR